MSRRFFVTGTDTGVGKTVLAALLCAALDAAYWKPIQTGSDEGADRETVARLAGLTPEKLLPEAYCFRPPVSPHLAAERAGEEIRLEKIQLPALANGAALIVEGAGGVLVPINGKELMVDLMKRLGLPVVLAARGSLGTINHTLLSLQALRGAGVEVAGVVMVGEEFGDNRRAIECYGDVRVVGTIPQLARLDRAALLEVFRARFDASLFR
jgi:dethiobiotin synthetase